MKKTIRVFPRRTNATPNDDMAFVGDPTLFVKGDEVHISVVFTWDIPEAERLAKAWEGIAPVRIGGPAMGMAGEGFKPGRYLKPGYVITSRGCPNKCWFCFVWRREARKVRELPVRDGWNVLDDNLLSCSEKHIKAVFQMLKGQKKERRKIEFTGGLEAARLKGWHVDLLADLKPTQLFFAYDTPDDYEPLICAGRKLREAGFSRGSHRLRAYVLIGWTNDTFEKAERRLKDAWRAGFLPMAMLWRDKEGRVDSEWRKFQRQWARPVMIACKVKGITQI